MELISTSIILIIFFINTGICFLVLRFYLVQILVNFFNHKLIDLDENSDRNLDGNTSVLKYYRLLIEI